MTQLFRSHRVMGREIGRTTGTDGKEYVILQTSPTQTTAALAHTLMPVTPDDAVFDLHMALLDIIQRADFLGVEREKLLDLFTNELHTFSEQSPQ